MTRRADKQKKRPDDLKEACVLEARRIIDSDGIEALSMREVARRLGVSHQAPYKHFPSRDHIIAEVVARAYRSFAAELDGRPKTGDPLEDMTSLGPAYLDYARRHPLEYKLMFETPLPDPSDHPEMLQQARHSFDILRQALQHLMPSRTDDEREYDALFVWATIHGMASMTQSHVLGTLGLGAKMRKAIEPELLGRIDKALDA